MKRCIRVFTSLMLAVGMMLTGCGTSSTVVNEKDQQEDIIEIGMCFDSFVIERWEKDRDIFVSTAQTYGATVNVQNANGDVDKQIEQIEYLIDKKVDCIVIIPIDGSALADVLAKAREKKIPTVCYDRLITNGNADLYIYFDNHLVGTMMGETIVETGAKSVVMICGPLTDNNVPMVEESFESVMRDNGIEIVDKVNIDGWKAELGSSYVDDNIDKVRNADAIMCGNDDIATSVIRALAVCKLAGVKSVVGQDADLPACQHIVEGTQDMSVYKPVEKIASKAAKLSVELAKGETIDVTDTISDGTYDIPYVAIEPIPVTLSNMDSVIIDGGFHNRDDVYLNSHPEAEEQEIIEEQ